MGYVFFIFSTIFIQTISSEMTDIPIVFNRSELSSKFCIPFDTCSTNINRMILMIIAILCIASCCCYYQCYEYSRVRHDLNQTRTNNSRNYHPLKELRHNPTFSC